MASSLDPNPHGDWKSLADHEDAERTALEARHQARRQQWLAAEMKIQHRHACQQLGWLGAQFMAACQRANAAIDIDVHLKEETRAVLNTHHLAKGFQRELLIGKKAAADETRRAILRAYFHEQTHLTNQYDRVAATHATPFNTQARVVLSPRSAMILNVAMERQAFGMGILIDSLLDEIAKGKLTPGNIPPPGDMQRRLQAYAGYIDPKTTWADTGWKAARKFLEFYRSYALARYEDKGRIEHMKDNNVIFAKIGLVTLRQLNDCLGMETFGSSDTELSRLLNGSLTAKQQRRVQRVEANLGIDEQTIPYFEDALVKVGTTPEEFLRAGCRRPSAASDLPATPAQSQPSVPVPVPVVV